MAAPMHQQIEADKIGIEESKYDIGEPQLPRKEMALNMQGAAAPLDAEIDFDSVRATCGASDPDIHPMVSLAKLAANDDTTMIQPDTSARGCGIADIHKIRLPHWLCRPSERHEGHGQPP